MRSPVLSYETGVYQLIYETSCGAYIPFVFDEINISEFLQLIKIISFFMSIGVAMAIMEWFHYFNILPLKAESAQRTRQKP